MLTGFCGRGDCSLDCNECLEREEEMESEICDVGHEEIVYFSGKCPLCEALIKNATLSDTLEVAVEQLEEIVRITESEGVEA